MARSIALECERHGSKPAEKKKRAARNTARRRAISSGKIKKGSKMDVHHKDVNASNTSPSNFTLVARGTN